METTKKRPSSPSRPVITQDENNTTLWIGHLHNDPMDHFAGQTFQCPSNGLLNNIQVYSSAVYHGGHVDLTLHAFDPANKSWGTAIATSTLNVDKKDHDKWVRFELQPVSLNKDAVYGFRLQTRDALIGIGEAAHGNKKPFTFGHEWSADSVDQKGHFYSYFSLAFKVELCA